MKTIACIICLLGYINIFAKEQTFTASTPGGTVVKTFLGIPLTDSIDFIRWKITVTDNAYKLWCQYGISKPNTNGFINDGKKIELAGTLTTDKNYYTFRYGNRALHLMALNKNLLHILDAAKHLLVGNGGWSYTLNNIHPSSGDQLYVTATQTVLPDSMVFEGRTPCGVPGLIGPDEACYKLKWLIVLYADAKTNAPTNYRLLGTSHRKTGGLTGKWQVLTGMDGRIIYRLNDGRGAGYIYLVKADNNVLAFADAAGKLLVGNEDFGYTLNSRKMK